MNAIHLLKQQHDEVKHLFEKFEKADEETEKDSICQKIANNLAAHMTIEERIFYPAVFSAMNDEAQLSKSMRDHEEAKQVLAQILDNDMSRDQANFETNMRALKLMLADHIAEEEQGVFKETKKVLGNDALTRLGEQMKDLFEQEMAGEPAEFLSARDDMGNMGEMDMTDEVVFTEIDATVIMDTGTDTDADSDKDNAPL